MPNSFLPHDLLWISSADDLTSETAAPPWVRAILLDAPVVVVRRVMYSNGLIPVGIRGRNRSERYAAMLPAGSIIRHIRPEQLAEEQPWQRSARAESIPAISILETVATEFSRYGLAWGPTGSVGFELATGRPVTKMTSDLDLILRAPVFLSRPDAEAIMFFVQKLAVTVDVQIETPFGCIALHEYADRRPESLLMRTCIGPMLVTDPWQQPQGWRQCQ